MHRNANELDLRLKECFRTTDLEWRLAQIPDDAKCRGAFLNALDDQAGEFSAEAQRTYRDCFSIQRVPVFKMISVKTYLTHLMVLSQIQFPDILDGLRVIMMDVFAMTAHLFGQETNPGSVDYAEKLAYIESVWASKKLHNYSTLSVRKVSKTKHVVSFGNEYLYIGHAMVGGLEGVAVACGIDVACEAKLSDPFNGEVVVEARGAIPKP